MQHHSSQSGFTLVELLVSLGLFTVIVVAAVGSLYTVNRASAKVTAMRTVLDNLNFATESISRTIRTGQNIVCGGVSNANGVSRNCSLSGQSGGNAIISLDSTIDGESIQYVYGKNITTGIGEIDKCTLVNGQITPDSCIALTAPEIDINSMTFYVDGADANDGKQPSVMIVMQGRAMAGTENIQPFAIQTLVSQRAAE